MNRIVTYIALLGLLLALAYAAPAKKSENTEQTEETQDTQETKQTSQETTEELTENTKEESKETSKSEDNPSNQEVTRYQDIEVDNDSKVTTENEVNKRSQSQVFPQKVAEHILTQNEAITLVTELTDEDYVEEFLKSEGAQGLFEALDLLKDQGWITDMEYTIISDSIYQLMLGPVQVPYDIQYESSYPAQETEQLAQPIYTTNTLSSYTESEQGVDTRLASIVSGLLDRVAENDMTSEEGAEIIGTLIKFLYGIEQAEEAADYNSESEWVVPEQFFPLPENTQNFQLPNDQPTGYRQNFDIVNQQGEPIGQAEEMVNNYKTDDGELGQELAALEKVAGKYGDNGLFQGQQQVYEKEAFIPLSPMMSADSVEEELGSGSSEEDKLEDFMKEYPDDFPWQNLFSKMG